MHDPITSSSDPLPQTFERRAYIRYSRNLEALWQFLGLSVREMLAGRAFDLSATGVGLILDQAFPLGTTLILRLPTATSGWGSHLVHVKNCEPGPDGKFQVGCAFVKPLSATQLQGHLE